MNNKALVIFSNSCIYYIDISLRICLYAKCPGKGIATCSFLQKS